MNQTRFITASLLIFAVVLERIIAFEAGWWNFSAIGAVALFGGAMFGRRLIAFLLPLIALLISDIYLAAYGTQAHYDYMMGSGFLANYAAYPLIILLGTTLSKNLNIGRIALGSLASSILFFLISNLFVFFGTGYTHDFAGFILCYEMAVPFFQGTLISDALFNTVLFGGFYLLSLRIPELRKQEELTIVN